MDKKSFFVPWQNDFCFGERQELIKLKHNYKHHQFYFNSKNRPYISLINDNITQKSFINALVNNDFDKAVLYISRFSVFANKELLKDFFDGVKSYNYISVSYKDCSFIGEKVSSVFISDKNNKKILHFYLINEPDSFSKWKIYHIEEEKITSIRLLSKLRIDIKIV